jgi:cytochrome c-type biogenesis protein
MTRTKPTSTTDKKNSKFLIPGLLFIGTVLIIIALSFIDWTPIFQPVQDVVFIIEESYRAWLVKQSTNNPLVLLPLAFAGGIISSLSPCQLSLLGVNLSYIGTREFTSRKDALIKATAFVLGVVTILSLLGLFSSFAGLVMIGYRGYVNIVVGLVILLMGLSLLDIIRIPLPKIPMGLPVTSPYSAGLTFALVSSPCTSPVLIAVLTAAGETGSPLQSTLTMVSYALGTSAIIFFASLFAGLAKQTRVILKHSEWVMRIGSAFLIIMGGFYLVNGIRWVLLV